MTRSELMRITLVIFEQAALESIRTYEQERRGQTKSFEVLTRPCISMKAGRITKILYSSHFERALKALPKEQSFIVAEREKMFRSNCFDPKLKTHKLKGNLGRYWSFSITYSHRIMFQFLDSSSVAFIDVGNHVIYQ